MKHTSLTILPKQSVSSIVLSLCILLVSGVGKFFVSTQGMNQWSPQQRIPDYGDEFRPPCLVADMNYTVHVFNNQPLDGGENAIFYRKWSIDQGWTHPIDIILSPLPGAPQVQGCFIDKTGFMHLVFFAGNEIEGEIYYSRVPAINASMAPAWSKPVLVGQDTLPFATLAGDGKSDLFILFSGKKGGMGLYEVHSTDEGITWSQPATVFMVNDVDQIPTGIRLTIDLQGRLHAVWSVVNTAGHRSSYLLCQIGI